MLWLVRHGQSAAPAGVAVGASDPPLSAAGLAQAQATAADLATQPLTAVYSSDRRRAISTAAVIAGVQGLDVAVDARLNELDFGAWEGRDLAELWQLEPAAAAAWERDLARTPPSFGENLAQLQARVASFWDELRERAGGEVAIVAHRGSLSVLWSIVAGLEPGATLARAWEPGAAIRVEP